jgi:superfamily II DNA or RNA helicase
MYDMDGFPFALSVYRVDALDAFYQSGRSAGGIGALACGSGKTAGSEFILIVIKINKIP